MAKAGLTDKGGVRRILEADLWEISIVTFPMLPSARVSDVKHARFFRDRETEKLYWAVVVGVPPKNEGAINLPLAKRPGARDRETMQVDEQDGQKALTHFRVLDHAGKRASLLALWPRAWG